ncbi:hypothetical protein L2E82_29820 [Cichorium intybus]|uniref:Uncharacterized protein n=1 Tax=Cichorium intybus TaxID=13427 RepID=A0ACB9CYX0_CICIN|nr:hypothetical protein L2E82_29820 [Cichorium intybus]
MGAGVTCNNDRKEKKIDRPVFYDQLLNILQSYLYPLSENPRLGFWQGNQIRDIISQFATTMVNPHFDDTIKVIGVDADGKKYDKVSRIEARGEESDMYIVLDVNSQLYPMHAGEKYRMVLSQTLHEDGSAVTSHNEGNKKSLADRFEYVMHGLLYKISDDKNQNGDAEVAVYVSFGGLQLLMKGTPVKMGKFKVDQRLFLLLLKE